MSRSRKPINLTRADLERSIAQENERKSRGRGKSKGKGKSKGSDDEIPYDVAWAKGKTPFKLNIGRSNIKISDTGSAAELGRELKDAFDELASHFRDYINDLENALPVDMANALEPTMELSLTYCPVAEGDLKASAYLAVEKYRGGARVEMGYGKGGHPDYAIYVHEMPYQHEAPTRDKFLEVAVDEDYFNIVQRITWNLKARMGL